MTDDYPDILNVKQVADLLGMNVQMVRKAAREGTLPAYRLPGGRAYKFFKSEILEWLRSHPATGSPRPSVPSVAPESEARSHDRTPGTVETAIRQNLSEGQHLSTPTRDAPFTLQTIDNEGIVLLLGEGEWATRLTWECLEGIVPYIRQYGGIVDIGGQHQVEGKPGTLDGYLKACVKRTTAGWVAVVLEKASIVRIVDDRPARIRLV